MQTKLQELTEKIYQEGINKAQEEADKILSNAKREAQEMVSRARREAEDILAKADKESEDLKKNSLNELQLSARQAISDLKQKLVALVETKIIKSETTAAFKDSGFVAEVISTIVKNWDPNSGDPIHLKLILPARQQKELDTYFKAKATDLLSKTLDIAYSDKLKGGFKIGPKDGGFLVSFSDDDFENFFQAYLRPKLIELLFEAPEKQ